MPTSVRVAIVVLWALAGLLLLVAGATWFARDEIADAIVNAGGRGSHADAARSVVVWLVPYLLIGLVLAGSAVALRRRRAWARWTGIAAAALLATLTLVSILAAGGVTLSLLLALLLSIAAISSLMSRTAAEWLPRLRARG